MFQFKLDEISFELDRFITVARSGLVPLKISSLICNVLAIRLPLTDFQSFRSVGKLRSLVKEWIESVVLFINVTLEYKSVKSSAISPIMEIVATKTPDFNVWPTYLEVNAMYIPVKIAPIHTGMRFKLFTTDTCLA